jgi:hypothetical protein
MKIEFPDRHAINPESGGIKFPASVDGKEIVCQVSSEALQDINPAQRHDPIEKRFKDNKSAIQSITKQKIQNGESNIFVSSDDVKLKDE